MDEHDQRFMGGIDARVQILERRFDVELRDLKDAVRDQSGSLNELRDVVLADRSERTGVKKLVTWVSIGFGAIGSATGLVMALVHAGIIK